MIESSVLRTAIYLPAKLYELGVRLRVALYEQGYLKTRRLDTVVISVGNITVGGTGKTPVVEYICRYLAQECYEVAVLTRGYGRKNSSRPIVVVSERGRVVAEVDEAGDEPLMLARKLAGVSVVVGADRYQSGLLVVERFGSDVLVLDDGFQHLRLERDLNILVLDATDLFGGGQVVPLGRLREPIYGLRRADAVVVTRSDRDFDRDLLFNILDGLGMNLPIFYSYHDFVGLKDLRTAAPIALRRLNGARVAALCALGRPSVFLEDLQAYRAEVVTTAFFPDHHSYRQEEIDRVVAEATAKGAEFIVTTEKDLPKLQGINFAKLPVYVAEIQTSFEDEVRLKSMLLRAVSRKQFRELK